MSDIVFLPISLVRLLGRYSNWAGEEAISFHPSLKRPNSWILRIFRFQVSQSHVRQPPLGVNLPCHVPQFHRKITTVPGKQPDLNRFNTRLVVQCERTIDLPPNSDFVNLGAVGSRAVAEEDAEGKQ